MTIQDYMKQGIDIATLPLRVLINLDIKTIEEQEQVQKLVDARRKFAPVATPINLSHDKTDFKTGEQEQEFQKVIDARVAAQRVFVADDVLDNGQAGETPIVETPVDETPVETTETIVDETPVDTPTASEELSAKETTLKTKIKKLKKAKKELA